MPGMKKLLSKKVMKVFKKQVKDVEQYSISSRFIREHKTEALKFYPWRQK